MTSAPEEILPAELAAVLQSINLGVLLLDSQYRVAFWNDFMAIHSGKDCDEVRGRSLFDLFPELPRLWVQKKIDGVFALHNLCVHFLAATPAPVQFRRQPAHHRLDRNDVPELHLLADDGGRRHRQLCLSDHRRCD
ncbi:PAS domain-containing protein [Pseudomonas sp. CC6-YY-74]|uniref:PAS domain-containing protein n=1 Tax=Pseudomonas sp. CC6-YY-74 TaxID=1930532 RepID=UPI002114C6B8|nr:PAS domain-containing protein [Pseudomonas sp. CC6-YY-74]